jgi:hypothetical protein
MFSRRHFSVKSEKFCALSRNGDRRDGAETGTDGTCPISSAWREDQGVRPVCPVESPRGKFGYRISPRLDLTVLLISQTSKARTITTDDSIIAVATRTDGVP